MHTHTHTEGRRGGGVEGQRGRGRYKGAEGRRGGGTGGQRDWGAEVRNGIMLGMFNSCTSVHPYSLAG